MIAMDILCLMSIFSSVVATAQPQNVSYYNSTAEELEYKPYAKYGDLLCWGPARDAQEIMLNDVFQEKIDITFTFADCGENYANYTMSVLIGAVDFRSRLVRLEKIYKKKKAYEFRVTKETVRFPFQPVYDYRYMTPCDLPSAIKQCFVDDTEWAALEDGISCFRRADVVFIDFEYDAAGEVALEKLEISIRAESTFGSVNATDQKINRLYVHPIMMPCNMKFEERAIYQIGPSLGMFKKSKSFPELGDLMGGLPPNFAL